MYADPNGNSVSLILIMLITAAVSLITTYTADVIDNVENNESGFDILVPHRSLGEYVGNTVGGFLAPAIPFGSTMMGKIIEVNINEILNIKSYSKEERTNIYKEAFTLDIVKTTLTFGVGQLLGTNPLSNELYNTAAKAISNVVVYVLDYLDTMFGQRSEGANNGRIR